MASTDLSVLIVGESGVGKEVIPRIIHDNSVRKHSKYFAINCGSIPEGTIDSELFGHAKGAFTGAVGEREGYFGAANKGTLFLDEVGELPLATQARLLRVLETGEYIRVGESEVRKTDVRIVAATNLKMQKAISEGRFREDLYYRLNTIPISLPPLRERGRDIDMLFRKFAIDISEKYCPIFGSPFFSMASIPGSLSHTQRMLVSRISTFLAIFSRNNTILYHHFSWSVMRNLLKEGRTFG